MVWSCSVGPNTVRATIETRARFSQANTVCFVAMFKMKQCKEHCRTESKQNYMLLKEMITHCKSAAIRDSFGHKGALFSWRASLY